MFAVACDNSAIFAMSSLRVAISIVLGFSYQCIFIILIISSSVKIISMNQYIHSRPFGRNLLNDQLLQNELPELTMQFDVESHFAEIDRSGEFLEQRRSRVGGDSLPLL